MAEGTAPEAVDPNTADAAAAVDMEVEKAGSGDNGGEPNQKRAREEGEEPQQEEAIDDDVVSKKQKVDEEEKSVEEQRLEKLEEPQGEGEKEGEEGKEEEKELCGPVKLGPKSFESSTEMFNYFYNFLHAWPHYLSINKV